MVHFFTNRQNVLTPKGGPSSVAQEYKSCSVLYSCATEEGPLGAKMFCLLVKKVCHMFNTQLTPP